MSWRSGVTCRSQSSIIIKLSRTVKIKPEPKSQLNNLHKLTDSRLSDYHKYPAFPASATLNPTFRAKNFSVLLFTFPWATGSGGKWARSHATLSCHKVERKRKKTAVAAGVSRARCYRRAFKKRTRRKVSVSSVCWVSVARRGFPAARRRDRNRSAWRSATPYALCVAPPRARLARASFIWISLSRSPDPAPHASHGRPRFPAVRLRPQHGRTSLQTSA